MCVSTLGMVSYTWEKDLGTRVYPCHGNHNAKDGWLIHVNAQLTKQGVDGRGGHRGNVEQIEQVEHLHM